MPLSTVLLVRRPQHALKNTDLPEQHCGSVPEDAEFEETGQIQWVTGVGTHLVRCGLDDTRLSRAAVAQDEAGDLAARLDFLRGAAHAANVRQVTKQGRVDPSHNDYPVSGRGR